MHHTKGDSEPPISTLVGSSGKSAKRTRRGTKPVLLVAWSPQSLDLPAVDRVHLEGELTVGRGSTVVLKINDSRLSASHFVIKRVGRIHVLEDLGSTNGTFVNGDRAGGGVQLTDGAVIRAGESIFVFHVRADELLAPAPSGKMRFGMAGSFHLAGLLRNLEEAALSDRNILLTGPSGVGKELAARVLAAMWNMDEPLAHNAARMASEQEASRVLFGVADKAFTGVAAREGLILAASSSGRPLFLDEIHHLPRQAQGVLLRVIEEGKVQRTGGEDKETSTDVRFIFASNAPDLLAPDLLARLREMPIPSLKERVADVPAIFDALISTGNDGQPESRDARESAISTIREALDGDCYEDLCLAAVRGAFDEDNVRGLADLTDRIVTRVAAGTRPDEAVDTIFAQRFLDPVEDEVSHYERQRELISSVYLGSGKNVLATVNLLKDSGVPWRCSRRHLTAYLEKWGIK